MQRFVSSSLPENIKISVPQMQTHVFDKIKLKEEIVKNISYAMKWYSRKQGRPMM